MRAALYSVIRLWHCFRSHRAAWLVFSASVATLVSIDSLRAQEGVRDAPRSEPQIRFRFYRWQEDYLWLSRKAGPLSDYEGVKYIRLGGVPENYLSLGGELRYRLDGYDPYLFGLGPSGKAWNSNQERIFLHADLHLSRYFRTFVQFDAAKEDGRPIQRAFDQSAPDLRQAFGDLVLPMGTGTTTLRAGRQELWLGPSRWLGVRDPTNIRRSFDGGLLEYKIQDLTFRGFAARPVFIKPGLFDDSTSSSEFFRGVYGTAKQPISIPITVDFYLLGKEIDSITFARGTSREDRWTAGTRAVGKLAKFDYVAELAYQFGTFDNADISAWGFFGQISHTLAGITMTPQIGLRGYYASGDRDLKSSTFRTFSAPYLAANEISGMSFLSVSNMINLEPYLQLALRYNLMLSIGWDALWKATATDAVYERSGALIRAPGSQANEVAQVPYLYMTWDITRFLQVQGFYSHTFAGNYIKDANGGDFDYYRFQILTRF